MVVENSQTPPAPLGPSTKKRIIPTQKERKEPEIDLKTYLVLLMNVRQRQKRYRKTLETATWNKPSRIANMTLGTQVKNPKNEKK